MGAFVVPVFIGGSIQCDVYRRVVVDIQQALFEARKRLGQAIIARAEAQELVVEIYEEIVELEKQLCVGGGDDELH